MTDRSTTISTRDVAALGIGLIAVSFSAILIRLCSSPPTQIAFYRLFGAGLVFLVVVLVRNRSFAIERRDLRIALAAAVLLATHFYFWIASLFMTSINSSVVLLAVMPLFALVLQRLILRTRITRRNVLSLMLGLTGAAILAGGDLLHGGELAGVGDLYALFSASMAAAYLFTGSFRRGPLLPYLTIVYLTAGVLLLGVALIRGDGLVPLASRDWIWFALLAAVPTLIGHTMLNRSATVFPSYVVNLSVLAEPLLTAFWAWLVFSEVVTTNVLAGATFIFLAVVMEVVPGSHRPARA